MSHTSFVLDDAIAILERTPAILRALLPGLPGQWLHATDGPDGWTPIDVLVHLINGERTNWMPRARHILAGQSVPFVAFDRTVVPENGADTSVAGLLATFDTLRQENIAALRQIQPADLARTGIHPEFGAVTLAQLLSTWVVHDLNHLAQITQTLANVYNQAVGPWKAYLDILR